MIESWLDGRVASRRKSDRRLLSAFASFPSKFGALNAFRLRVFLNTDVPLPLRFLQLFLKKEDKRDDRIQYTLWLHSLFLFPKNRLFSRNSKRAESSKNSLSSLPFHQEVLSGGERRRGQYGVQQMFLNIQYVQRNGKNRGWPVSNRLNDGFNDASPFLCLAADIDSFEMGFPRNLALVFYYISIACIFYTNRCCSFHVSFRETCIAEGEPTRAFHLFSWNALHIDV